MDGEAIMAALCADSNALLIRFKTLVGHDGRGASFRGRDPVFAGAAAMAAVDCGRRWWTGGRRKPEVCPGFIGCRACRHRRKGADRQRGRGPEGRQPGRWEFGNAKETKSPKGLGLLTKSGMEQNRHSARSGAPTRNQYPIKI